jgi:hypothetical protein
VAKQLKVALLEHNGQAAQLTTAAAHDGGVTEMLYNPFLLAYKDNPRFIAFAQKVGVMPKADTSP